MNTYISSFISYLFRPFESVKVKVTQLCLTLCNYTVHGTLPGQNTEVDSHSLLQAIFPTWVRTQVSCIAGGFFTN